MSDAAPFRARLPRGRALELADSPVAWIGLALAIAAAVLVADRVRGEDTVSPAVRSFYLAGQSAYVPTGRSDDENVVWTFDDGLPESWAPVGRVLATESGDTVSVRTGTQPAAYQLISPPVRVGPGAYQALVQGAVDRGGLSLGVIDPDRESFVANANFWSGQSRPAGTSPAVAFELTEPTTIRVVLSNWAPAPSTSNWTLARVAVRPLQAGQPIPLARVVPEDYPPFYEASMSSLIPAPSGQVMADWDFGLQLPAGWRPIGAPRTTNRNRALEVLTTQTSHAYQFVGPPVELPPGSHSLVVDGRIVRGGMMLGVLDDATSQWVKTGLFWDGQKPGPDERLGVTFTLERATRVRVILANWAPEPNSSSWSVRHVGIVDAPDA